MIGETQPLPSTESAAAEAPEPQAAPPASGPQSRARRRSRRAMLARVGSVTVVAGIVGYLQFRPSLPFVGGSGSQPASGGGTAGFVTFGTSGTKLGASSGDGPKIGSAAPDFTLLDPRGAVVRLSDFRGKTVVMNFWATWCKPCRKEFPLLVRLYNRDAPRGLVVFGVDLQESPDIVGQFLSEFNATYPVAIDSKGDVGGAYRLLGLPTTYFIDPDGVIRAQHLGELTDAILTQKLAETGFTAGSGS